MYTGMNFLPLCTAIVCPINSGRIVDRRDQVFTTFFSFRAFSASTLARRWSSMNGPFFSERGIGLPIPPPGAASPTARGEPYGTLAPARKRGVTTGRKDIQSGSPARSESSRQSRPIRSCTSGTLPGVGARASRRFSPPASLHAARLLFARVWHAVVYVVTFVWLSYGCSLFPAAPGSFLLLYPEIPVFRNRRVHLPATAFAVLQSSGR
jgi:hypothetical protein